MTTGSLGRTAAFTLLALLGLGGCSDADDVGYPSCSYRVCPIDEGSCSSHVASVVGCKMGIEPLQVPVRYLTVAEVLAEQEAQTDPPTSQEEQDYADYARGEALVGLMPPGHELADLASETIVNFSAFYSRDDEEIVILTDQAPADPQDAYLLLVHEMVHAYQDAERDLDRLYDTHGTTFDRTMGLKGLTEGEAVLHQSLAAIELAGFEPHRADWDGYFRDWQSAMLDLARESEMPRVQAPALFPYAFGGELVVDGWRSGADRVDALYDEPPDSVRQVMGGYGSWPMALRNEDASFDPAAVPVLPAPYELIGGGHESVWLLNAMLQRTARLELWHAELDEVSADYFSVFRVDDDVVVFWRVRSTATAALLDTLVQTTNTRWTDGSDGTASTYLVTSIDDDLLLVAVSQGDASLALDDIEGWQSPQEAFEDPDVNPASRWRITAVDGDHRR
ncbi:MAG: hypothetical protein JRI23_27105 [Deltaproteobacteria bacterium]|jgi:hypothetical protein|nr:hypothetical protein [Deltaproteobacteria bacterium]MBW2535751.1 hypothetical protein [Deltaproteobacteria bacterium]